MSVFHTTERHTVSVSVRLSIVVQLPSFPREPTLLTTYRKSIPTPLGQAHSDMKDMEEGLICFPHSEVYIVFGTLGICWCLRITK